jgi:hypothetical protein
VKEYESLRGCKGKFMDDLRKELIENWLVTGDVLTNPFTLEYRSVVLGLNGNINRFDINASSVNDIRPARGVAVTPKKKRKK